MFTIYTPELVCLSKVHHIGFGMQWRVRLNVLQFWSAANRVVELIEGICQTLVSPDPRYWLIPEVLQCYLQQPALYQQRAREWTDKFAIADASACTSVPIAPPRHV